MRRRSGLLLVGLLAYGVFVVLRLPAPLVFAQLQQRVPALAADGLEGSLWQGSAAQLLWRGVRLGRLEWRFDPQALLRARIGWRLNIADGDRRLSAHAALGLDRSLQLRTVQGELPMDLLQALTGRSFLLDGRLQIDLSLLELNDKGLPQAALGDLRLVQARLISLPDQPLGPFQAKLQSGDDQTINARLQDQGGPLMFDAVLKLTAAGRYRVSGRLATRADSPPRLTGLLGTLGADGNGSRRFDFNGQLL